jgi:hypothetical protein
MNGARHCSGPQHVPKSDGPELCDARMSNGTAAARSARAPLRHGAGLQVRAPSLSSPP